MGYLDLGAFFLSLGIIPLFGIIVSVLIMTDIININQSNPWLENTIVCWGKPSRSELQNKNKWASALLIINGFLLGCAGIFFFRAKRGDNWSTKMVRFIFFIYAVMFIVLVPWGIWWNETQGTWGEGCDLSPRLKRWLGEGRYIGFWVLAFMYFVAICVYLTFTVYSYGVITKDI